MSNETVLVVDDDASLRELVAAHLRRECFRPIEAASGEAALAALSSRWEGCGLVILDIMLGGADGFEVLKKIRQERPGLPVILLSARGEDHDKVLGFGLGADDYVTKPFSPAELMARVKARLRKPPEGSAPGAPSVLAGGPFRLDIPGCVLSKDGKPLELSARELGLMRLFLENPGRVFTKTQIYARIWEGEYCDDNTVIVNISRLRDKVEADSGRPVHILTVRGLGYKFVPGTAAGGPA